MKIYWTVVPVRHDNAMTLAYPFPDQAFKCIVKNRSKTTEFLKCPAVQDFFKNVFVLRSPVDLTIVIDVDGSIRIEEQNQMFFDNFIINRTTPEDNYRCLSLNFNTLFTTESDVEMEQFPAFMEENDFVQNTRIVPGKFNIGRWIRPLEFSFEINSSEEMKKIKIKRGDALCYVRFLTDEKVVIEQSDFTQDLYNVISACTGLKRFSPGNTLEQNYEVAKSYMKVIRRKIFGSKCPFRFK